MESNGIVEVIGRVGRTISVTSQYLPENNRYRASFKLISGMELPVIA